MDKKIELPKGVRFSLILLGIVAFLSLLFVGREIIVPLIFSLLIAILLNPVVNFLARRGLHRIISISIAVLLAFVILIGLFYFIGSQANRFSEALPMLKQNLNSLFKDAIVWTSQQLNISTAKINEWLVEQKNESMSNSTSVIGQTLTTIGGVLIMIFLLPVYIFLFLYYKPLLLEFISKLFPENKDTTVSEVLTQSKFLIQSYLVGLLMEAGIVAALNSTGLFILGIDYAILLGVIGALLNIIPYIGGIIAISLPMIIALATKEPIYVLYVFILYTTVQLIDNNFIVPKIVASKVKVNALVSIIVVLIGNAVWGVPGMFLSLPLTAIIKVIFDRIDSLKPLGFLIGDAMPPLNKQFSKVNLKKK